MQIRLAEDCIVDKPLEQGYVSNSLDALENIVDLDHVVHTRELQCRAFAFESVDHIPTALYWPLPRQEWPAFTYPEMFGDPARMLLSQLGSVYMGAKTRDDRLYGIRADYGTGIIASMFGCEVRVPDETLPIALKLENKSIDQILDEGIPDMRSGIAGRALDTVAYFREALAPYPKLSAAVGSQMLDIQGPFDNTSIMLGMEAFLAISDQPEKFSSLMRLIAETTLQLVKEHRRIDGQSIYEHGGIWNFLGGLCVRNDSSVSLSGSQYRESVMPADACLLSEYGGWIHFCGNASQWCESLLEIPNLKGINPYQGEFYDLERLYSLYRSKGIAIVGWAVQLNERCRGSIRTGLCRLVGVDSFDSALRARDRLHSTGHAD